MYPFASDYDSESPSDELVSAPAYMRIIRNVENELRLEEAKFKMQVLARENNFKFQKLTHANEFKREQEAREHERLLELKKMKLKA